MLAGVDKKKKKKSRIWFLVSLKSEWLKGKNLPFDINFMMYFIQWLTRIVPVKNDWIIYVWIIDSSMIRL